MSMLRGAILLGNASEHVGEAMNPYCVILWTEPLVNPVSYPRTKRFFLRAGWADGAIQAALADNPHWRVVGIEPRDLLLAFYKVLLHALNLTIGTLPETRSHSGRKRCASLPFLHPAPAILIRRGIWQLCLQSCPEHHTVHERSYECGVQVDQEMLLPYSPLPEHRFR
jgi:hypothetical protein